MRRGEKVDHYETVRQRKDGSLVNISLTVSPIRNAQGEIVGASKIARNITGTRRAQERQELLLREMDHRVKNLFALAIGVLRMSGRSANSAKGVVDTASARLAALARAHALTLSYGPTVAPNAGRPTTLYSLIEAIAAPYHPAEGEGRRFSITGCDIEISGSIISNLALLLHEFATNSAKYGALTAPAGEIRVHCANEAQSVVIAGLSMEGLRSLRRLATTGSAISSFAQLWPTSWADEYVGNGSRKASSSNFPCRVSV